MLDDFKNEQSLAVKILKNSISNNRLVHAYLFETNGYYKSNEFIRSFIKEILCSNINNENHVEKSCNVCTMINDNCYPELKIISPDGMWIKKEQLDELQEEFNKKAIIGYKKIYVINEAEKMNLSAVNSILKFLEEPFSNIIAILVTDNIYQLLDTIISRCQIISFKNVSINYENDLEMIANLCINDFDYKEKFLSDDESIEKINKIKEFIKFFEKNKLDSLIYTQEYWFNYFNDKESNIFAYNVMILYYRDILNYKIGKNLVYFKYDYDTISSIGNNLEIDSICNRITKIMKAIEKIKFNVNLNLLLDNLLIDLEKS